MATLPAPYVVQVIDAKPIIGGLDAVVRSLH
jgi:hypothetical protein